jgi:hypothetical protein
MNWRWIDPAGNRSGGFRSRAAAERSAVWTALVARRPGKAVAHHDDAVPLLWRSLEKGGWRIEEDPEWLE